MLQHEELDAYYKNCNEFACHRQGEVRMRFIPDTKGVNNEPLYHAAYAEDEC